MFTLRIVKSPGQRHEEAALVLSGGSLFFLLGSRNDLLFKRRFPTSGCPTLLGNPKHLVVTELNGPAFARDLCIFPFGDLE